MRQSKIHIKGCSGGSSVKTAAQLGLLLISIFQWVFAPSELQVWFTAISLTVAVLAIGVHCFWKRECFRRVHWLDPDLILIPGYLMVHFWTPVAIALGLEVSHGKELAAFERYACASLAAANVGLICVFVGVITAHARGRASTASHNAGLKRDRSDASRSAQVQVAETYQVLHFTALLLGLAGLGALAVFVLLHGTSYLSGSYQGINSMDRNGATILLGSKIFITSGGTLGMLILQNRRLPISIIRFCAITPVFALLALFIWHGDRGECVAVLLPLIAAFYLRKSPTLISVGLALAASFPVLGVIRLARGFSERGLSAIVAASSEQQVIESYQSTAGNLGFSGGLTGVAMALVEEKGSNHGIYLIQSCISVIPFSNRLIGLFSDENVFSETNPSVFLTMTVRGTLDSGTGTNTVASALLDLGSPGVLLIHFLLGYVFGYIVFNVRRGQCGSIFPLAHCLTVGIAAVVARYDVGFFIKLIGLSLILFIATATAVSLFWFKTILRFR
jgi:hypothetical protein